MVESASVDQASGQQVPGSHASGQQLPGHQLLSVAAERAGIRQGDPDWTDFERRFDLHFPDLFRLFHSLYGSRPDWQEHLTSLLAETARSWKDRPGDLKVLDAGRDGDSDWFQSNRMLGGVCYVDRYAADL